MNEDNRPGISLNNNLNLDIKTFVRINRGNRRGAGRRNRNSPGGDPVFTPNVPAKGKLELFLPGKYDSLDFYIEMDQLPLGNDNQHGFMFDHKGTLGDLHDVQLIKTDDNYVATFSFGKNKFDEKPDKDPEVNHPSPPSPFDPEDDT